MRTPSIPRSIASKIAELEAQLQQFVNGAAERLQADIATLYLYDVERDKFYLPVGYGLKDEATFKHAMPRSDRIAGKIVKRRTPIVADDARAHDDMSGPFTYRERIKSSAGLPIFLGDQVVGVFFVSYATPHHFDEEQTRSIEEMLYEATGILAASRLAEVRETLTTLSPVESIADTTLGYIINSTCTLTGTPVVLWVLEPGTSVLSIRASTGVRPEFARSATVRSDKDQIFAQVMDEQRPIVIQDLAGDPRFPFQDEVQNESWCSLLAMPVTTGDRTVGVLAILSHTHRDFTPAEYEVLSEVAQRAGDVLAGERRADILANLRSIGLALASRLELSDLLHTIVETAAQIFSADVVIVYVYDEAHDEFAEAAARGLSPGATIYPVPGEIDILTHIVVEGKPVFSGAAGSDQRLPAWFVAEQRIRSWAAFPLQVGTESVGVFFAMYRRIYDTLDAERELLEFFASQAAVAIKNANLFQEQQRRVTMSKIAGTFSQTLDRERTLEAIVKGACQLTGAMSSSLYLLHPGTGDFERSARWPVPTGDPREPPRREEGLSRTIINKGEPILISDTRCDERVRPAVIEEGKLSLLGVPVQIGGQRIGVLYVNSDRVNHFRRRDIEFLRNLADYGAIAIQRTEPMAAITNVNEATAAILGLDELINELLARIVDDLRFRFAALQLVNQESQTIETAYGINAPWAAEAEHDLDSDDIQADIIRRRQTEILTGWDERFDKSIYERYGHDQMIRIFVPLVVGETAFGTVEAGHDLAEKAEFSPQERAALEQLVAEYALRLWEAMLPHALGVIVENAVNMVRADSGSIHVFYRKDKDRYVYQACAGRIGMEFLDEFPPRRQGTGTTIPGGEGPEGTAEMPRKLEELEGIGTLALRTGKPQRIDDPDELYRTHRRIYEPAELWSKYPARYPEGEGVRAIACFPLLTGGKYEGVFYIHYWKPHTFGEDEMEWLQLFAAQVSVAIRNAQFYEKLRWRSLALTSLSQIGHSLQEELNLSDLLTMIVRGALVVLDADVVTIYQYYQDRDQFDTPPTIGGDLNQPTYMQNPIHRGDAPWNIVHQRGRSCYAPHVRAEPLFYSADGQRLPERGEPFVDREEIQSAAGILLKTHQEIVGIMFVNYRSPKEFSSGERRIIESFASYAAIAIRTARKAIQQRIEQLEAIQSIDREISATLNLDRVLQLIVEKSMEHLKVGQEGYGFLQLYDERSHELVIRAHQHLPPDKVGRRLHLDRDRSITTLVAKTKQPLRVPDTRRHRDYQALLPGMRSEIAVPLVQDHRLVGVLNLESRRLNAFDETAVSFLMLLANQAVIAIQNARHVEQMEQMRRVLETITSTTNLETVLEQIVESTLTVLQADDAVIFPYDPDANCFLLELVVHRGQGKGDYQPGMPKPGGITYQVLERGLIVVEDVSRASPDLGIKAESGFLGQLNIQAFAGIALKVWQAGLQRVLGVLYVDYRKPHEFTQSELTLTRAFADQAAIGLQRARQEERERKARALEEINIFGTNFVHKVINLLGTLPANFAAIESALKTGDQARLALHLPLLHGNVQRVDQILKAARILRNIEPEQQELIPINEVIEAAISGSPQADDFRVSYLPLDPSPQVRAGRFSLQSLFEELINNAAKAKAREVTIRARVSDEGPWIQVTVEDDGKGIASEVQHRIFQPFYTTSGDGVGLGLWLGLQVVREMGGDIRVASEPGRGSTFALRLPIAGGG